MTSWPLDKLGMEEAHTMCEWFAAFFPPSTFFSLFLTWCNVVHLGQSNNKGNVWTDTLGLLILKWSHIRVLFNVIECTNTLYMMVLQMKMCPSLSLSLPRQMLRVLPLSFSPHQSHLHKESQGCTVGTVPRSDACLRISLKPWFTAIVKEAQAGCEERKRETERVSVYWELLAFLSLRHLCHASHCSKRFTGRMYAC